MGKIHIPKNQRALIQGRLRELRKNVLKLEQSEIAALLDREHKQKYKEQGPPAQGDISKLETTSEGSLEGYRDMLLGLAQYSWADLVRRYKAATSDAKSLRDKIPEKNSPLSLDFPHLAAWVDACFSENSELWETCKQFSWSRISKAPWRAGPATEEDLVEGVRIHGGEYVGRLLERAAGGPLEEGWGDIPEQAFDYVKRAFTRSYGDVFEDYSQQDQAAIMHFLSSHVFCNARNTEETRSRLGAIEDSVYLFRSATEFHCLSMEGREAGLALRQARAGIHPDGLTPAEVMSVYRIVPWKDGSLPSGDLVLTYPKEGRNG